MNSFDLVLLDLNGTFMFDHDRFGSEENYHKTYLGIGGSVLTEKELSTGINALVAQMTREYSDPRRFDSFPSVRSVLKHQSLSSRWSEAEREYAEMVIALHELGTIPEQFSNTVIGLSESKKLGLVSNLWSRKDLWILELNRAGLGDIFDYLVFSSDGESIKPSPQVFNPILDVLRSPREKVLMIGDSMSCDIAGAHAAGFRSMFIDNGRDVPELEGVCPDFTIRSLLDLGQSNILTLD